MQLNESNTISEQKPCGHVWHRLSKQTLLVTVGTHVRCCVLCRSFVTSHSPCAAALPGAVASPSLAPPPSHFSHLPVWHRAACPRAGVLGSRGFSVESAAARVCWEVGARVSTNLFVIDLDLPVAPHDARRLEVVADGLPLFGRAQLAIDTTLVSPVRGEPRGQCARQDGAALTEAHRLKHRTYLELSGSQGRARLVVLAAKVGGRWSEEAQSFVSQLARAKVRSFPRVLRGRARQAWQHRWSAVLSCATARAFALSLLDRRAALGCDGDTLTVSDAVAACRHLPDLS